MSELITQDLCLSYGIAPVIRDLRLSIPPGKMTALIGANGCGKSTLLKGLARLLKPSGGAVYLDGKSIEKRSTREVAQQLGLLSQSPTAPDGLTVKNLVSQGRYPHQHWMQPWSILDEQFVQQALAITNLTDLSDRPLESLSGGQRQRAWIAMTLAQNPDILLLDEPTTFLDLAHQIEVLDLLHRLNQTGRTIVMILHDLNQASRYADYIVAIKDGQIFMDGEPHVVITEATIKAVFNLQCRIYSDPIAGTPLCIPIGAKIRSKEWSRGSL